MSQTNWAPAAPAPSPLSFTQAMEVVNNHAASMARPPQSAPATLLLAEALGRVLAAPVLADRDQPPFDRATRDGHAVRAQDVADRQRLRIVGQVSAGEAWPEDRPPLAAGECAAIMTGAPMPPGTDAVLMVEHGEVLPSAEGDFLCPHAGRTLSPGENVVFRGSEARRGDCLVPTGARIGAAQIAMAAACGLARLSVFPRPRVAVLATGDELVDPGAGHAPIVPQEIYNSNSHSTAALVRQAGAVPVLLPIARDSEVEIAHGIQAGLDADLLLLTGGVSMGKYDLVEEALASFGAEFFFTGVRIQPGRPLVFGQIPSKDGRPGRYFFGLPGNPLSTMVTFALFVRPLLAALAGEKEWQLPVVLARLTEEFRHAPGLTRFLPAWLETAPSKAAGAGAFPYMPSITPVQWHGSGDLAASARANCYLVAPEDRPCLAAESCVPVLLR